jgi:DNA-binding NarL/FixJ family response regulator
MEHRANWRVAILDLLAQEGSGFGLISRFKRAQPDGKVIVFSEYATPGVKRRCLELGADAAFLKSELAAFVQCLEESALPA